MDADWRTCIPNCHRTFVRSLPLPDHKLTKLAADLVKRKVMEADAPADLLEVARGAAALDDAECKHAVGERLRSVIEGISDNRIDADAGSVGLLAQALALVS